MFSSLIVLATLALPAFAQTYVSVAYDTTYDNSAQSMDTVACSNGVYGLASAYPTFGSVPNFPYIGGAPAITGWDSPSCGTCWELTYSAGNIDETIYITAIDVGSDGFVLSEEAMNTLTNGNAVAFGRVSATVTQVDPSSCGL